jgi:REP element-mobilizing transposase RayT
VEIDFRLYRRTLPHLRVCGGIYFVTWRLAPSQPELTRDERTLSVDTLRHFERERYDLLAFVVMNDHVHVMVRPLTGRLLEDLVHCWKSYTANRLQRLKARRGCLWQSEYFDRLLRDSTEGVEKAEYILRNPYKRWPQLADYPWAWVLGQPL